MSQWWGFNNDDFPEKAEDCDTIITPSVLFRAKSTIPAHYTWKIGTDTRDFHGKEFNISFNDWRQDSANHNPNDRNIYNPIPITLTVRYKKEQCVKAEDTLLQFTRNLVFVKGKYAKVPPYGKFVGKTKEDKHERTVEIVSYEESGFPPVYSRRIAFVNFPNLENQDSLVSIGGGGPLSPLKLLSYKYFWWDKGHDNYEPHWDAAFVKRALNDGLNMGKFFIQHVPPNDLYINFDYKHVTKDGRVKTYSFKGKKIN